MRPAGTRGQPGTEDEGVGFSYFIPLCEAISDQTRWRLSNRCEVLIRVTRQAGAPVHSAPGAHRDLLAARRFNQASAFSRAGCKHRFESPSPFARPTIIHA